MSSLEIGEDGSEGNGVADFLILIRVISLRGTNFRVAVSEIIVEEGNMATDAQTIGDDANLGGIAEVTVDILLASIRIGLGNIRHKGIDGLVRVETRDGLCKLLCFPELSVEEFRVILGDREFDTGGIIDEVIGFLRVDLTADWLGQVHKVLKHLYEEGMKILPESRKLGSIRDLVEAAEIAKLSA